MECKGCHQAIVAEQYRLVADWPFCLACFERLGKRPEPRVEPSHEGAASDPRPRAPSEPPPEPAGAAPELGRNVAVRGERPPACAACEQPMTAADQAQMGQLGICIKCRQDLIVRPFQKVLEREAFEKEARAEEDEDAAAAAAIPIPKEEIFTPGTPGKKTCAQCSRRLLEPRGYNVIDGQPYCPSCSGEAQRKAQARKEAAAAAAAASVAATPAAHGGAPAAARASCEACDRPFSGAEVAVIEGFSLCRPCFTLDLDAALSVARARHKARLRKLREELSG